MRVFLPVGSFKRAGGGFSPAQGGPAPRRRDIPRAGAALLAIVIAIGVACSCPRAGRADIYAGFSQTSIVVPTGGTFTAYVVITQADAAFNAFDASIGFDPAMLSFVPTSPVADQRGELMTNACSNTFHRFTAASDSLKITLSLLCSNTTVSGPGTIYKVQFQAGATPGTTTLRLGPFTEFYQAGIFVRPLHTRDLTVNVGGTTGVDPLPGPLRLMLAPPVPNPRRGEGAVRLEFMLPRPDRVGFDVLDVQGRRVASRDAEPYGGGWQQLTWSLPRLRSGDYFVRLRTRSGDRVTRRWVVLE